MNVRIPKDENFEYEKCENLYLKNQLIVNDDADFDYVINNTFFYSFYKKNILSGCAYLYFKNKKLFINGFSVRKSFVFNILIMKAICKWFTCDIYAESIQKPAILLLLRCGFKKLKNNIYVYYND